MNAWALDTETFLIFPGYLAPEMVCTTWAHAGASGLIHGRDPGLRPFVGDRFAHEHLVFANAPFDLGVYGAKWPDLIPVIFNALDEDRIHDVQTREKLLDLARGTFRFEEDEEGNVKAKGYSLADVVWRKLGKRMDKDTWRMRYHELWDTPCGQWPAGARNYATGDAIDTLSVFAKQEEVRARQLTTGYDVLGNEAAQVRAHWALHLMSAWGFKTNQASVERLERRVRDQIAEIRDALVEAKLVRPDGTRDTKAAVRRMAEAMGDEAILTDAGLNLIKEGDKSRDEVLAMARDLGQYVSVSETAAELCGDKTLLDYSLYTKLRNLLTGSIKDLKSGTITPVQTRYEVLQATGRTSSSGPNIQNLRRAPGVRECFVPRDGNVIIACDYSQAELHTWAQVCFDLFGESALRDALNEDIDVHTLLAARVIGASYEDVQALVDAGDDTTKNIHRRVAKHANFAFMGGASAKRFRAMVYSLSNGTLDLDLSEAARVRAMWHQTWPEAKHYFDYIRECSHGNGFYWVKQARVDRIRANCTYTSAANALFQGLASDGAKAALYAVTKEQFLDRESALYGTACLAFVHDEILIEAPEGRAHEAAMRLQTVMEHEFNKFVPDCPTQAEPTIMRYWSKAAKQVWTDTGRLVAWDPEAA